ncbi:hypothetical protein NX059_004534 [Plenodomus lindquistii]|nr:hypothetical protein NX059_004534 [Plenodomus lindquistii]
MSTSSNPLHPTTGTQLPTPKYHDKASLQDLEQQTTLLSPDSTSLSKWHNRHHRPTHTSPLSILLFFTALLIALLTYLSLPSAPPNPSSLPDSTPPHPLSKSHKSCGPNATTAKTSGCIYDILAPQWIPVPCYNATLSTFHAAQLSRPLFYKDENLTQPLGEDAEELSTYETIWTTDAYHTQHCAYILELAALAAGRVFRRGNGRGGNGKREEEEEEEEVWLNALSRNQAHTKHCTEWLTTAVHTPGPVEIHRPGAGLGCYLFEEV